MTEALQQKLDNALTLVELEDIYLPYKPERKTKAQGAREKGLEPLALLILEQRPINITKTAEAFVKDEIKTVEDALQGARDIIAEMVNEEESVRPGMRKLFQETARIESKILPGKETEAIKLKIILTMRKKFPPFLRTGFLRCSADLWKGFLRMEISPAEEGHWHSSKNISLKVPANQPQK